MHCVQFLKPHVLFLMETTEFGICSVSYESKRETYAITARLASAAKEDIL
jgi:hypothetical protein